MSKFEVLIRELVSVNTLSACAIEISKVSSLHHEALNYSVENGVLEREDLPRNLAATAFSSAKLTEILCGTWDDILE